MRTCDKVFPVAIVAILAVVMTSIAGCGGGAEDVVGQIPLDSKLAELDRFLGDFEYDSQVIQWLPRDAIAAKPTTDRQALERTGRELSNEYGNFTEKRLGTYSDWRSNSRPDEFTGEVHLYVGNLASSDIVSLIYVDGVLRKKDWGHLPG